jgi:hypothetical protein
VNGPIAQLAAITCHANAFLSGRDFSAYFPDNSTCHFCDCVEFLASGNIAYAASPDDWIHALPDRDVDGLCIRFEARNDPGLSDRLSAGFVGGGRVGLLEVRRDDGISEYWLPDWQVQNEDAEDRRIWHVAYRLHATDDSQPTVARSPAFIRTSFRERLQDIVQFARGNTRGVFDHHFIAALAALDDPDAAAGYHPDVALPGQLSDDARAMLHAAMQAWVFGGMGTWNDLSFEQPIQTEYENLSDGLFSIVHEAIESAVNSTFLTS